MSDFKCHFCRICNGSGCIGEMPGMGGPNQSRNFIHNYRAWEELEFFSPEERDSFAEKASALELRLAPMTGAVENVGYPEEKSFYFDMIDSCAKAGFKLGIGDGTPDCKLQYGIEAVREQQKANAECRAAVFIKPYPDERILERIEWASGIAECYGIDIDSYNIVTMRNLVHLEKKTASQLKEIKKRVNSMGIPFVIKGLFTKDDLELVHEVKPDAAYVSNHGGRVDTREGSTAQFLLENSAELRKNSGQLWADGGIRSFEHVCKAASLGVSTVLIGRPVLTALCGGGSESVSMLYRSLRGKC